MTEPPNRDLLHDIAFQMLNDSQATSAALAESLWHSLDHANATLDLIRERIDDLLLRPYAPSESVIRAAMYPDPRAVKERAKEYADQRAGAAR